MSSGLGMWKVATRLGGGWRRSHGARAACWETIAHTVNGGLGHHGAHAAPVPVAAERGAFGRDNVCMHMHHGGGIDGGLRERERERERGAGLQGHTAHTRLSRRCPPAGRTATAPTTRALATEVCGGEIGGGGAVRPLVYKK